MAGHKGSLLLLSSEIPFFPLLSFRQLITSSVLSLQGVLLGMSNTAGVLAGVLGTAATGYILQNGKPNVLPQKCQAIPSQTGRFS